MPNDKEIANFDQSSAFLTESLPPFWKRMYDSCLAAGFDKDQALLLVRTHIFATSGGKMEK